MKRILILAVALAGLALIPSTASAWNGPEPVCVPGQGPVVMTEQEYNAGKPSHPEWIYPSPADCQGPPELVPVCRNGVVVQVPKDQVQPGEKAECAPVVPPEQPPTVPETPTQPTPPAEEVPEMPTVPVETPKVVPDQPQHDLGPPAVVRGKEQQDQPPKQLEADVPVEADTSTLPYTGFNLWIVAALGAVMLAGGLAIRRAVDRAHATRSASPR